MHNKSRYFYRLNVYKHHRIYNCLGLVINYDN
nr:MAG TPA: hypothetical protein [Caudoviricetes sp.]